MSNKRFEDSASPATGGPPQLDDVIENATHIQDDDAPAPPAKRRSPVPFIAAGVLALVGVAGSVGYMVLGAAPSAPVDDYSLMQPPAPPPGSEAGVLSPAPAPAELPTAALGGAAPGDGMPASAPAAAPSAADAVAAAAAPAPAAPAPAAAPMAAQAVAGVAPAELDRVNRRIDEMERDLSALRAQRQAQVQAVGTASASPAPRARPTRPAPKASPAEEVVADTRGSAARAPKELEGLSLRAVYPASGPDMQAWVMEGDTLRVVSRKSVVGGALVLEVQSGMVITDRGVIR